MMDHSYPDCVKLAHPCMACKLRYWREKNQTCLAPLQPGWSDISFREIAAETVAHAKANNIELQYEGRKELI